MYDICSCCKKTAPVRLFKGSLLCDDCIETWEEMELEEENDEYWEGALLTSETSEEMRIANESDPIEQCWIVLESLGDSVIVVPHPANPLSNTFHGTMTTRIKEDEK